MSLTRHYGPEVRWQVDESGLLVWSPSGRGEWEVDFADYRPDWQEYYAYLERHQLTPEKSSFKSRARAVDAVRMALAREPLHAPAQTGWKRVSEGEYLSTDGRWRLLRSPGECQLIPRAPLVEERVARHPLIHVLLAWPHQLTLRLIAEHTDRLNQQLGLTAAAEPNEEMSSCLSPA